MVSKIKANNIEIGYQLDGPEEGQVVVFSNSLMSNYSMWDSQVKELSTSYRILRYDQRGHGRTETTPGPYSIDLLSEDVYALIDALGISSVHFVGLSMGGFTGQQFALTHPERLRSLVLCDTACIMPPKSLWNERIETARSHGIEALLEATLERWFTPPFHLAGVESLAKVQEMILGTGVEGFIGCSAAIRDMNLCDRLPEISVPTLIMVGEEDPGCPVSAARALHDGIVDSKLVIIPQAAHLPNIEQTAVFNKSLIDFLNHHQ